MIVKKKYNLTWIFGHYVIEKFLVESNKKYLFRVIGANSAYAMQISIEGHTFRVVGTDGNQMEPIEDVEVLIVHGGERYDIELNTKNETHANNYLIIVKILGVTDEKFKGLYYLNFREKNSREILKFSSKIFLENFFFSRN